MNNELLTPKNYTSLRHLIILPIISAILLGLTRTNLHFDMFVFVAFIPLFYYFEMIEKQNNNSSLLQLKTKHIMWHGALFSTIYTIIFLHWITLVTIGGFLGILFLFGTLFGFLFLIVGNLHRTKTILYPLSFIFAWLTFEYISNFTEFRFPWFNIGYGLKHNLPLLQILEFGGMPVLSFFILVINYLFYLSFTRKKNSQLTNNLITSTNIQKSEFVGTTQTMFQEKKGVYSKISNLCMSLNIKIFLLTILSLLIWFVGGLWRMKYVQKLSIEQDFQIALIQGNIPQDLKWEDEMVKETIDIYESLARQSVERDSVNLIVFPESALPVFVMLSNQDYSRMVRFVLDINTPLFTGFPHYVFEEKYKGQKEPTLDFNAANLFAPYPFSSENYYKNILVPFGERTPFLDKFPILWNIQMGQANFEAGNKTVIYNADEYYFAPLICFEIAFPLFIRKITEEYTPDFWINITNDAWFYSSIGTHQHAVMAAFRTIEIRKPIFRAANTGYSFYTTPDGKIHKKSKLFERSFVIGKLLLYDTLTPYVAYGYMINYIFILFFSLQIIATIIYWLRKFFTFHASKFK